jgi:predicted transposase/invertase (TIGR01784 family)
LIPDELRNHDNEPLIKRLVFAAADPKVQKQAVDEDSFNKVVKGQFQEGRQAGHAEGREEGREEGRAEGLEEGQAKERLNTAKRLKAMGLSPDQIVEATGLDVRMLETL